MEIGEVRRVLKVVPEPFPMGEPMLAPEEPSPAKEPEHVAVPA